MIYPASHHRNRSIFFWILAIVYITIVTTLIPYVLGYRFSFDRGIFIYAGSVTVKTNPRAINIVIDGNQIPDQLRNIVNGSIHIDGLTPGTHSIALSADGFHTWEKTVSVHSGISTEFWNVILPRTEYTPMPLTDRVTNNFFIAPNHTHIAFTRQDESELSINIFNSDTGQIDVLSAPVQFAQHTDPTRNIEWSPEDTQLIVPVTELLDQTKENEESASQRANFLVVDIDTQTITPITDLLPYAHDITTVRWHPYKKNTLSALANNMLWEISLEDGTPLIAAQNVATYTIASNIFYYINARDNLLYRMDNNKVTQITTTPLNDFVRNTARLFVYDNDRVALMNSQHDLFLLNYIDGSEKQFERIGDGVRGVHFSNDGKKLLWWTQNEINAMYVRTHDVQPLHNAGDKISIARFASTIDNVQWTTDYTHALYTVDDVIKITSLDHRGGHHVADVVRIAPDTPVRLDMQNDRIYFVAPATDTTEPQFSFIQFPENVGIF
jgi:hypothetical protein